MNIFVWIGDSNRVFLPHKLDISNKYYVHVICLMTCNKNIKISFVIAVIFSIAAVMGVVNFSNHMAFAQGEKFVAKLTGTEEVPPSNSKATGLAEFNASGKDGMDYKVSATNIQNVTEGHIHIGKKGENGPIVFTLFRANAPVNQLSENETITTSEFVGPLKDKPLSDLISVMNNGSAYANIHTQQNPNGEIRGQIMVTK
jgi:hypothetical protein